MFEHHGSAGVARLNRPKALNSLNLNMVRLLAQQYKAWEAAPASGPHSVSHVVLVGTGEKAFCAGGDIRAIYDAGKGAKTNSHAQVTDLADEPITSSFFREEYQLNHLIGTFKKPHISIIDGITSCVRSELKSPRYRRSLSGFFFLLLFFLFVAL